ncbi:MAG TPA: NAD-dependent epimerase/dehydratase family protein [Nitrososphaeraceae archaeon]|nr:NAD-dependent epimerase/dehydratase family protein [Nitrososphaeraceae archaeon]
MKILVTGGAGFIGSNLANTLIHLNKDGTCPTMEIDQTTQDCAYREGNHKYGDVIALDDLSLGCTSNLSKEIKFVRGSIMDYDLVLELSRGCDYIFHQAALSSSPMFIEDPRKGIDINVMGFMNIMESAKRNKVRKVIYASSSSLYNGLHTPYRESAIIIPKTFYESSFYCRETIARTYNLEYGVDSVGLRYFSVYGPNEKHKGRYANNISQFIWDMAEKKKSPVIYGDGNQTRDFTFVDDVVQANILAMNGKNQHEGPDVNSISNSNSNNIDNIKEHRKKRENNEKYGFSIYNVGTGIQTSFNRVVEIINKQLDSDIKPLYVKNPINNYVQHTMADISLARLELGYEPRWKNVEDGIGQLLSLQPSSDSSSSARLSQSQRSVRIY